MLDKTWGKQSNNQGDLLVLYDNKTADPQVQVWIAGQSSSQWSVALAGAGDQMIQK